MHCLIEGSRSSLRKGYLKFIGRSAVRGSLVFISALQHAFEIARNRAWGDLEKRKQLCLEYAKSSERKCQPENS